VVEGLLNVLPIILKGVEVTMFPRDLKASRKEFCIERNPAGVGCVAYPIGASGEEHRPLSM
jgi:hypothetical protein